VRSQSNNIKSTGTGTFMALIELRSIEKGFALASGTHYVLRNISLDIQEGEFVSITGPSGSGKTSLLNILGLLDADWRGEFNLANEAVHKAAAKRREVLKREHIGFIFQHYHLLDDLTVAENLDLPLGYRNISKSERSARVADMLDRFGIVGKKDLFPRQLSGGQQQQVAVARALITRPSLLLADEPTGALHTDQGEKIMDLLCELNRAGSTIVQVTHNPKHAARATRELKLRDGWLES
jgi:putative ABC transport system ATP-binding protein